MGEFELTQHSWQQQAQRGDLDAIAQLLQHITTAAHPRVQVTRHDDTLQVYLTGAHRGSLDGCALMIYSAVYALGLSDIAQLIVLEGPPQENHQRWQQTFTLASVVTVSPRPRAQDGEGIPRRRNALPEPKKTGHPQPWPSDAAVVMGAVARQSAAPPQHPAAAQSQRSRLPFNGRGKWLRWSAVVALSFVLGAAMAQWRYDQRQTAAVPPDPGNLASAAASAREGNGATASPKEASPDGSPVPEQNDAATGGTEGSAALAPVGVVSQALAEAPTALEPPSVVTVKAVGDIIMGTNYPRTRMPEDWQYFFDAIKFHLEDADLVFGNFESTLTEVPHSAKDTSRPMTFAFRSPPWYASVLRAAGFDVLSVANNHSMDFFEQGFNDTIANIESEGMIAVGRKGDIQYTEVNGLTVAFIGFSYLSVHNTVHDLEAAGALVQEAEQNADIVVISVHGGKEGTDATFSRNQEEFFYSENRGNLVHFSRTVVDYGADLVLGHGPHVPRAVELYNNRLIAYSLGNFLGYRTLSTRGPLGVSMILQVGVDGNGNFVNGRIIPAALDPNGVPYLDNHFGSVILVRNYTQRDFPETPLVIDDLGNISRRE